MRQFFLLISLSIFSFFQIKAQTVGTLSLEDDALNGYTFFSPFSGTKSWMVNNCGELINVWDRDFRPGLSAYFLDNGLMMRTYKPNPIGPFNSASNSGGIELVDWDNNTVWSYELNNSEEISHHDAVYMPNGNILLLTWELVYEDELVELGRDPAEIAFQGFMWSERIIEVKPVGNNEIDIMWEWGIKNHYIQDLDSTKLNFGVIAEHPELFNINLPELDSNDSHPSRDWNHFNAIDYNEDLDQILISVRNSDEIWILDHSTTSQEAASHEGGNAEKGGDILYRWGNASAYNRAPVSDQKFFGQHGVHWVKEGLNDAGKIMIFNNGNGRPGPDYSTIELLEPPQDTDGNYISADDVPFLPETSEVVYGDQASEEFFSAYLSNAQRLPNENTLIMAGSPGRIFEINPNREIVWAYEIPLSGDNPGTQGGNISGNASFRGYKFTPDFTGFDGIEIEVGETIENGENPLDCDLSTATIAILKTAISANFHQGQLEILNPNFNEMNLRMMDIAGRVRWFKNGVSDGQLTAFLNLENGIYFLNIQTENGNTFTKSILNF
jgi:hypothetical protein